MVLSVLPEPAQDYIAGIEYDCYAGLHTEVWVERGNERIKSIGIRDGSNDEDLRRLWDGLRRGDVIKWRVKTVPNMGSSTNPAEASGGGDVVSVNFTQTNWLAYESVLDEAWQEAPQDKKSDLVYLMEKGNEKFNELPVNQQRLILAGSGEKRTTSWGIKTGQFQIPLSAESGDIYNLGFVYGYSAVSRGPDEDKKWEAQKAFIKEMAYFAVDIAIMALPFGAIFKLGKWGARGLKFAVGASLLTAELAQVLHEQNEYFEKVGIYAGENDAGCGFTDSLSPLVTTYAFVVGEESDNISNDNKPFDFDSWVVSNQDKVGLFVLGASVLTIGFIYSIFGGGE